MRICSVVWSVEEAIKLTVQDVKPPDRFQIRRVIFHDHDDGRISQEKSRWQEDAQRRFALLGLKATFTIDHQLASRKGQQMVYYFMYPTVNHWSWRWFSFKRKVGRLFCFWTSR